MWSTGTLCDEFYLNARLTMKLGLEPSRESLLHFFEQIRKSYPTLSRLRSAEDGATALEDEDKTERARRYVRVERQALRFGLHSPNDQESVGAFQRSILQQAPYQLGLSELDYDFLEVALGFDFEYRGNHDQLIAETLQWDHPLTAALTLDGESVIDYQPFIGVTLNEACDTQLYLEVKGRTSAYEIRTGEFDPAPLSVFLTARKYWGMGEKQELEAGFTELLGLAYQYAESRVAAHILQPLAAAIASRR